MRIGINIPSIGSHPVTYGLKQMGMNVEEAGAQSLWIGDHLTMIDTDTNRYPYTSDGRPRWDVETDIFEAFTCVSMLAAVTGHVTVGTAVLVLPQRNVLEVAKTAASIDAISGGRLILGMGAGWFPEEFESLGYSFEDRGGRMNEMIPVLRDCWSGRPQAFTGDYVSVVENLVMHPKPAQPEGPPMWLGGNSKAALRRATAIGDGWLGTTDTNTFEQKYEPLGEAIARARQMRSDRGHRADSFRYAVKLNVAAETDLQIEQIHRLSQLGFDEVILDLFWERGMNAVADSVRALRTACAD